MSILWFLTAMLKARRGRKCGWSQKTCQSDLGFCCWLLVQLDILTAWIVLIRHLKSFSSIIWCHFPISNFNCTEFDIETISSIFDKKISYLKVVAAESEIVSAGLPHRPLTSRLGQGQSQQTGTPALCPTWVAGIQILDRAGNWNRSKWLGLNPVVPSDRLNHWAEALNPGY